MQQASSPYGMLEKGSSGKQYRRTAVALSALCVAMLLCAKLSVASHQHADSGGLTELAATAMQATATALSHAASGGQGSAAEATSSDSEMNAEAKAAKTSMFAQKAGWDKSAWKACDWLAWVIPGPLTTLLATGFVFGLYGPVWAAGILVLLLGVDVFSFYVNI